MYIQKTEKKILDALNQRKYLKMNDIEVIREKATKAVPLLVEELLIN